MARFWPQAEEGDLSNATALKSRLDGSRAVVSISFLSPLVTSAVPRLTWLFLFLLAIILVAMFLRRGNDWRQLLQLNTALVAVLLAILYATLSVIWAADRTAALGETSLLLAVALATFAATSALATLDKQQLRRAALAFTMGAFLGALFLLIELLTDGAITRMTMNLITVLQPERAKHLVMSHGKVTKINLSQLNRNVAVAMFHLWPGLLILRTIERGPRAIALSALFFLAVAVPVAISEHDSSQVALVGSLLVFPLAWLWRPATIRALAVLWCAAFVLVLPVDFLAFKANLHMATWLPDSFRARVILWEYTAEHVFDHPWLGIGAASTPALKEPRAIAEQPEGFIFPRTTGQHAHDLFLQTWYELGVVGVIVFAFAGVGVALRISLLPFETQPFAAATFATFASMAAFSWGIWQEWLMCAVGLLLIYLALATRLVDNAQDRQKPTLLATEEREPEPRTAGCPART
jgi:O-antigen ligase